MPGVPGTLRLVTSDLVRRPVRTVLAVLGVALSTALLLGTVSLHDGYVRAVDSTIDRMGYQVLVTAKGCPYEAASLALRGGNVPMYIDETIFDQILADSDVTEATRLFMQGTRLPEGGRSIVVMGADERFRRLKPWMTLQRGGWFSNPSAGEAILGFNAAQTLGLNVGDSLPLDATHRPVAIRGVFDRSGTQDDGMVFLPLPFAQQLFDRQGKLTGVGVRLRSLDRVQPFVARIFAVPSVQAITMTQFRSTVVEFVSTSRLLLLISALIACTLGCLGVLNAMTMSVAERQREFSLMRAVGASPRQIFRLTLLETGCLGLLGGVAGTLLIAVGGGILEAVVRRVLPLVPSGRLLGLEAAPILGSVLTGLVLAMLAGVYPALSAARVPPSILLSRSR